MNVGEDRASRSHGRASFPLGTEPASLDAIAGKSTCSPTEVSVMETMQMDPGEWETAHRSPQKQEKRRNYAAMTEALSPFMYPENGASIKIA